MKHSNKRLVVMIVTGLLMIGATVYVLYPELLVSQQPGQILPPIGPAPQPAASGPAKAPSAPSAPRLPAGTAAPGQVLRDLFAPPAGYAAILATSAKAPAPAASGEKTFSYGPLPVLTGVIQGADTRVAILRQGTISRSYRVGQNAGEFRVTAIGANSVTLAGPAGTTVLTMGK